MLGVFLVLATSAYDCLSYSKETKIGETARVSNEDHSKESNEFLLPPEQLKVLFILVLGAKGNSNGPC